jgi:hypothetical protein
VDALDQVGAKIQVFKRLAVVPILNASVRRAHDLTRDHRRAYECGAATRGGYFLCGATHIDVEPIETKLTHDVGNLIKKLWCLAVNLRHDRPLDFTVGEILEQGLRRMESRLNIDEFRQNHVGLPMLRRDKPE